jgi:aerobic carbon-monoxide dehydrogenase medium subunit
MSEVVRVDSVEDAQALLAEGAEPLAGGTWVMRSGLRGEPMARRYVALAGIEALRQVTRTNGTLTIGALVTHAELAELDAPQALVEAAAASAFPSVRNVATLGGNLCATGFAEADLVPALLALGATVRVDERSVPIEDFTPGGLVTAVEVPVGRVSAFERLTVRGAGEYAVASVAVSAEEGMRDLRIAIGSVEERPRLCGEPLTCVGRDGSDAPGWYREAVLPALLERAVARLERS